MHEFAGLDLLCDRIARAESAGDFTQAVDGYLLAEALKEQYVSAQKDVPPRLQEVCDAHRRAKEDPRYASIALELDHVGELNSLEERARAEQLIRFHEGGEVVFTRLFPNAIIPGVYKLGSEPVTIECYIESDDAVRLEMRGNEGRLYANMIARAQKDKTVIQRLLELYEDD